MAKTEQQSVQGLRFPPQSQSPGKVALGAGAFIRLDSATPMMSVTDECETLPSLSPHSQLRSPRAEVKEGGGRGHNYQYKMKPCE